MDDGNWKDLSKYRFDMACQCLKSSKMLYEAGDMFGAVNRSYYSIYNALRSVLVLDGKEFKKHSGTISCFQKDYVKTSIFSSGISDIIMSAFDIRNETDYENFVIIKKEEVSEQIEKAGILLSEIEAYLKEKEVLKI